MNKTIIDKAKVLRKSSKAVSLVEDSAEFEA